MLLRHFLITVLSRAEEAYEDLITDILKLPAEEGISSEACRSGEDGEQMLLCDDDATEMTVAPNTSTVTSESHSSEEDVRCFNVLRRQVCEVANDLSRARACIFSKGKSKGKSKGESKQGLRQRLAYVLHRTAPRCDA